MTDEFYMKRALKLARKGEGRVSPNPMVGAVIVKDGRIIGEGYHKKFGGNHAEINAINSASEAIEGTILYVTMEPCSHYGKTPPCTDRIVEVRPQRVVIGTTDPNPMVSGRGIDILKQHGIETDVGILEEECRELNEIFLKFIRTKTPFITLKFAQTIDGRIATSTGHSRWISSEPSLKFAHKLRSLHDGIMVGAGTILTDDPELTVRHARGKNPLRIVVDSTLRIQANARVLKNQESAKTIIATTQHCNKENLRHLTDSGIETLIINSKNQKHVDLKKLLAELGKKEISSVLVEGGSEIITSFLKEKIADRIIIITAPKIIGTGIPSVGDLGITKIDDSIKLSVRKVSRKGDDIIVDSRL
ncbi:MAG: bifunctional diaminohydroxyphosphoribosylaminopyrimidine deaminase/5-amino-6-(5-phosphoribosylamino)uracil reductase RibD [Syntrophales bacterium]|nr:bifunctional diaminohydroxyphosphoribosylaminopyrimidine deaminase/5-amino-6-(5-phosphoribosylamino)uracil reductase RibD [Syntrophales bacterium]